MDYIIFSNYVFSLLLFIIISVRSVISFILYPIFFLSCIWLSSYSISFYGESFQVGHQFRHTHTICRYIYIYSSWSHSLLDVVVVAYWSVFFFFFLVLVYISLFLLLALAVSYVRSVSAFDRCWLLFISAIIASIARSSFNSITQSNACNVSIFSSSLSSLYHLLLLLSSLFSFISYIYI